MRKAIEPGDLRGIGKATTPDGPALVDHTPDLSAHPPSIDKAVQEYRRFVLDSPRVYRKKSMGGGITQKVVYHVKKQSQMSLFGADETTGGGRFMVKPYHEKLIKRIQGWQRYPIQGWAEMTNQALYHAAGIGHLHQQVHVSEHDMPNQPKEPALVIHLGDPSFRVAHLARPIGDKEKAQFKAMHPGRPEWGGFLPENFDDVRKIAVMDMLSNNLDRHGGNLMLSMDGRVLAVDHSRSFQYANIRKDTGRKWVQNLGPEPTDDLHNYIYGYRDRGAALGKYLDEPGLHPNRGTWDDKLEALQSWQPVFEEWWPRHRNAMVEAMKQRLNSIKDPAVKEHIHLNFMARVKWMDERARFGLDNFGVGSWASDGIPWQPPGRTNLRNDQ